MNQFNPAHSDRNPTNASKRPKALALTCLLVTALPATVAIYASDQAAAGAEHASDERAEQSFEHSWEQRKHHKRAPVSLAELSKHSEQRFARLDTDTDGRVTRDEFLQAEGREHPKRREHMKRKHRMHKQNMHAPQPEREAAIFSALDKDGNGALSAEEFAARREVGKSMYEARHRNNRFDELDTNADGHLSADEVNARLDRLRALDSNNNGVLERDEMREARRDRRAERRG